MLVALVFLVLLVLWSVCVCLLSLKLFLLWLLVLETVFVNPFSWELIPFGWIALQLIPAESLAVDLLLFLLAAGRVSVRLLTPELSLIELLVEELMLAERRVAERTSCCLLRAEHMLHLEQRALETSRCLRAHNLLKNRWELEHVQERLALELRVQDVVCAELWMLELELREGLTHDLPAELVAPELWELERLSNLGALEMIPAELWTLEEASKLLKLRTRKGIVKPWTLGLVPELWTRSGVPGLWSLELIR